MSDPNLIKAGVQPKRSNAEINAELRAKAARQAVRDLTEIESEEAVRVRVTRRGNAKISTGQHVGGVGEVHYEEGEELTLPMSKAKQYTDGPDKDNPRDWVEILKADAP